MEIETLAELKEATAHGVTLVDFAAEWCGPCKQLAKSLEELPKLAPDVAVVSIDVDRSPELAQCHGVMSVPTILVFSAGELKGRLVGARSARVLADEIRSLV